jgi:hypothetical protein
MITVKKQIIPINMIDQRKTLVTELSGNELNYNLVYGPAYKVVFKEKSNNFAPVKKFLQECSRPSNANKYGNLCFDVIREMEKNNFEKKYLEEAQQIFLEGILPKMKTLDVIENYCSVKESISESFREKLEEKCSILKECDRVITNNEKLSSRFNFDQIVKEKDVINLEDTIEYLCELIDTYNISVPAKLNTTLENVLYSYDKAGYALDKQEVIKNITEYFLRYNDVVTDNQYSKICNVLENNKFISEEDINKVYYLFTEQKSFGNRVVGASIAEDKKYKDMIQQLNNCKTLSAAKILIKKSFELIFNTFIVTALVSFATVTILLAAVFALILSIISAPIDIIKTISEENKRIDKYKLSNNEKDRQIQVVKYVSARLTEVQANPVKEAANMLDDLLCQDSETFNHGFIMDPDDFDNSIISDLNIKSFTESKDFAESEDVKTIINKYKADQNKSIGKIKTALSHSI